MTNQRLEQGMDDLVDALGNRQGGVQGDTLIRSSGKRVFSSAITFFAPPLGSLDGVGAGQLVKGDQCRRLPLRRADLIVVLSA